MLGKIKLAIVTITLFSLLLVAQVYAVEEVITNGGCENGYWMWNSDSGNNEQSGVIFRSGARSFLDSNLDTVLGNVFYQTLDIDGDSLTNFTCYYYIEGATTASASLDLHFTNNGSAIYDIINAGSDTGGSWVAFNHAVSEMAAGYEVGDTLDRITITMTGNGDGTKIYLDDLSLNGDAAITGPTYTITDSSALLSGFMEYIVPLIVILIPAFFMAVPMKMGKWGFITGIAIGSGLGFAFFNVPAWVLFLITIGLVGMAYQSVKGG